MTGTEIIEAIMEATLSTDEIRAIWDVLKAKSDSVRSVAVHKFRAGTYVMFAGRGQAGMVFGVIQKRNRKTLTVAAKNGKIYRVSPSLLTEVTVEQYDDAPGVDDGAIAFRCR
jgi:hypothetical protein